MSGTSEASGAGSRRPWRPGQTFLKVLLKRRDDALGHRQMRSSGGQLDGEHGALARAVRLGPHAPVHGLRERARDGETDARAAERARA